MSDQTKLENPYVGLKPFDTSDSMFFFGRKHQTAELLQKLHKTHFLAVVGSSGCGKSSLIRAGLIPYLKAGFLVDDRDQWQQVVMKPGNRPLYAFVQALYNTFDNKDKHIIKSDMILEKIAEIKKSGIRGIESFHTDKKINILLLVDQFEEIFESMKHSKTTEEKEETHRFVEIMLELANQRLFPVYIVLTMRSDFLGDCDRFFGLPEAMNQSQYLVPRMSRDQRMEAIKGPAALLGRKLTGRLMQRLLNDSSDNPDHLPILQHAMMRTWDNFLQCDDLELDILHYEQIGCMDQALSMHADEIYNRLNEKQQKIAEKIFKAITNKGSNDRGVRRPTKLSDLYLIVGSEKSYIRDVINAFRQPRCKFIFPHDHFVELKDNDEITITHESLMRVWERFIKWADEEAESVRKYLRLVESAALKEDEKAGFLHTNELAVLIEWKNKEQPNCYWGKRYHENFDQAMKYLTESQDHANQLRKEAEENEKNRQKFEKARQKEAFQLKITRIISFFLCIALIFAGFSGYQYYNAEQARVEAVKARGLAEESKVQAEEARVKAQEARLDMKLARDQEQKARVEAESALEQAKKQRRIAEEQRKEADRERQVAQDRYEQIVQLQKTLHPLAEKQGRLYINIFPEKADISIEELNQDYTNGMKLDKGFYTIRAEKEGYYPKKVSVKIKAGKENLLQLQLQPISGKIIVDGKPSDAKIYVNAIEKGTGHLEIKNLNTGIYAIRVEKKGYKTFEKKIELKPEQTVEKIKYNLTAYAYLTVHTKPEDARIRIMNINPVYTPGIELSPGKYDIDVSKKNFVSHRQWIELNGGEKKHLTISLKPDAQTLTNSINMTFVLIPSGSYKMGSSEKEPGREQNEILHQVILTNDFYMQTTEVTQRQWLMVMKDNPSDKKCGLDCPVENVSWKDVNEFIKLLNSKEKTNTYRLPTEAEWEYAARSGLTTPYFWGDEADCSKANYGNSWITDECKGVNPGQTMKVASFSKNAWGLYDMHGNVNEWCSDFFGIYPSKEVINPTGPSAGRSRVFRGGSWQDSYFYCRAAYRGHKSPSLSIGAVGFRLVKTISKR